MKMIGNEVYIQRGETWALDFAVKDKNGHPFTIPNDWKNPYIVITVAGARYEQKGDFRRTYWLDLTDRWVEQADGSLALESVKTFTNAEPLFAQLIEGEYSVERQGYSYEFDIPDILSRYGVENGGNIVLDTTNDNDITNFLFYGKLDDGTYLHAYCENYENNGDGTYSATWKEYDFRVIKQFITKDWTESSYLYDIKILTGESLEEHIAAILDAQQTPRDPLPWNSVQIPLYIDAIEDLEKKREVLEIYMSGAPLFPDYEVKNVILPPTKLYTSTNIQGGVR